MASALEAQKSRRLDDAEQLYREAIALTPDSADALHMLGVIRYERRDYAEAKALILRALDLTGWRFPNFRHNLGLVVARANDCNDIGFVHRASANGTRRIARSGVHRTNARRLSPS